MTTLEDLLTNYDYIAHLLKECQSHVDEFEGQLDDIADRLENLAAAPVEFLEEGQENIEEVAEQFNAIMANLDATCEEKCERFESIRDQIVENAEEQFGRVRETASEMTENLTGELERQFQVALSASLGELGTQLTRKLEANLQEFLDFGDTFRQAIDSGINQLKEHIVNSLKDTIEKEVRLTMEAALDRVMREVTEGVVTSTIGVQLTAALSPILPQLVVARVAAGAIKTALEIMRMGF